VDERDLVDRVALDHEPRPWWSETVRVALLVVASLALIFAFYAWLERPRIDVGNRIIEKCAASGDPRQLDTCIQDGFKQEGFTPLPVTPAP
jgi:hypothetical protein